MNTFNTFEKQTSPARAATPQILFSGAYLQGKIFFGLRQSSQAAKDVNGSDAADAYNGATPFRYSQRHTVAGDLTRILHFACAIAQFLLLIL